jgi:hypothetical protein
MTVAAWVYALGQGRRRHGEFVVMQNGENGQTGAYHKRQGKYG